MTSTTSPTRPTTTLKYFAILLLALAPVMSLLSGCGGQATADASSDEDAGSEFTAVANAALAVAGMVAGLVVTLVVAITQSGALAVVMGIGLLLGVSWVATRLGLVLPAAAIGERMTLSESWAATRPVSGQILLPLVVIALVVGLVGQVIVLIFGEVQTVQIMGQTQEQLILSLPGQVINGLVTWLQLLVNLALMTTLYGNLIEGRALN